MLLGSPCPVFSNVIISQILVSVLPKTGVILQEEVAVAQKGAARGVIVTEGYHQVPDLFPTSLGRGFTGRGRHWESRRGEQL